MANKIWVGTDSGNEGDWSVAANWSPSGVPASSDDVFFEDSSQDVTAGFNQSAVALSSLNIDASFTGKIGDASSYLQIGTSELNIGMHNGPGSPAGSGRIKIDLGSTACTAVIYNAGTSVDDYKPTVRLKANSASTTIEVRKGKVGAAYDTGETSTIGTISVSYDNSKTTDADVFIGDGVTLTNLNQIGGECVCESGVTTINVEDGTLTLYGSGAITTCNVKGGDVYPNSTGTISTLDVTGGNVDFTKCRSARTVSTAKIGSGGAIKYDPSVVTMTNKVQPSESSGEITLRAS